MEAEKEEVIEENGELVSFEKFASPIRESIEKEKEPNKNQELKRELSRLEKKKWYLVDFTDKWLVFLDSQNNGLWEMLKTLLSQDQKYLKHQVTNKSNSGKACT